MSNNKLIHFKSTSKPELLGLIDGNITYSVLYRILQNDCKDIFTNGKSVIICYSNAPYPVWVWCKEPYDYDDINQIAECIKAHYPLREGYNVIMSHGVLKKLSECDPYFLDVSIKMELLSYQLTHLKEANHPCDGYIKIATEADIDTISVMFKDMNYEMEGFVFDLDECKKKALNLINLKQLFTWRNKNGEIVALTSKKIEGKYGNIASVYTAPAARRSGYAINLVHTVCKDLLACGLTPILYTDGGYAASNDCYKKIGFEQVGRLYNIEK